MSLFWIGKNPASIPPIVKPPMPQAKFVEVMTGFDSKLLIRDKARERRSMIEVLQQPAVSRDKGTLKLINGCLGSAPNFGAVAAATRSATSCTNDELASESTESAYRCSNIFTKDRLHLSGFASQRIAMQTFSAGSTNSISKPRV